MKQYYETVDLEKIAEESGCIPVTIHYFKGSVDVFLRPVDLSELMGKVWDAGFNKGHADGSNIEKFTNHPDKSTFINSLLNPNHHG